MEDLIRQALETALDRLMRADAELLVYDANERSISHRFAVYLEELFPGWNVDCEYNRDFIAPKRLDIPRRDVTDDDTQAVTVFPDIIIHRRGTPQNLLVVEMKKTSNPEGAEFDHCKLLAFKNQLGYRFAAFINLRTGVHNPGVQEVELIQV